MIGCYQTSERERTIEPARGLPPQFACCGHTNELLKGATDFALELGDLSRLEPVDASPIAVAETQEADTSPVGGAGREPGARQGAARG